MSGNGKKVAVLLGGWSAEREVSLVSGKAVAEALGEAGYDVTTIDVSHDPSDLIAALTPAPAAVFNALHGHGGEDGCIQGLLEMLRIPYTHSGILASAIAMDKPSTKLMLSRVGMPVTDHLVIRHDQLSQAKITFPPPYVIKPADEGSSVGVHIIRAGDNRDFSDDWLPDAKLMIERYIPGRELTVGVRGFTNEPAQPMAVTEIQPKQGFYDYEAKYTDGKAQHVVPAEIPDEVAREVMRLAVLAHQTLGCSGISRSDFRWDDSQTGTSGLFFLEINTQPGFTPLSLVPEQAAYLGISFQELVAWLVEGARCHA